MKKIKSTWCFECNDIRDFVCKVCFLKEKQDERISTAKEIIRMVRNAADSFEERSGGDFFSVFAQISEEYNNFADYLEEKYL